MPLSKRSSKPRFDLNQLAVSIVAQAAAVGWLQVAARWSR